MERVPGALGLASGTRGSALCPGHLRGAWGHRVRGKRWGPWTSAAGNPAPSLTLVDRGTASLSGPRGAVCRPAQTAPPGLPTAELSERPPARLDVLEDVWRVPCHLVPRDASAPSSPPAQRAEARSVRPQTVAPCRGPVCPSGGVLIQHLEKSGRKLNRGLLWRGVRPPLQSQRGSFAPL